MAKPARIAVYKAQFVDDRQPIPGGTLGSSCADQSHEIFYYPGLRAFRLRSRKGYAIKFVPEARIMDWQPLDNEENADLLG